ncbi:MAG TPA: membrane protein insertase YidC [Rhodospirillaceae bacterium]|nr:membrane protein insertase YidC [Rhodospirillaceae bacterium]
MDNNNFLVAVVLSVAILVGFHYLYEEPQIEKARIELRLSQQEKEAAVKAPVVIDAPLQSRDEILDDTPRIKIETSEVRGSIQLKGARLNDLELLKYRETTDPSSPEIVLLSPASSAPPHKGYVVSFGWLAKAGASVPTEDTIWKADRKTLTTENPVLLSWNNGQGLLFERFIEIDENFMFTVTDRVRNKSGKEVQLYPFGSITRYGLPSVQSTYVLHEGLIGVLEGTLKEIDYEDLMEGPKESFESEGGWLGFTDKYWLVSLIPEQNEKITASFSYEIGQDRQHPENGVFQTDFRAAPLSIASGTMGERTTHLFAGAKSVSLLDGYSETLEIPLFDRAIDFGWYYYLTKPFLYLLHEFSLVLGSMALAIVLFTVLLKVLTLPLSLKSSRSMARLKELQPEIKELQERYKDDKQQANIQLMEFYKREKVSPVSGCVPMLIQIPIFFALYKVLYVGIEMRHAPLFGWVKDMSAPDPSSVLTLFGALDVSFLPHVGVWPILMGISMFAQQKLSPQPTDKSQARIFLFMPIMFTFMMAQIAVGLIFYWTVSNILGIGQQWYVMYQTKMKHPKK